MIDVGQGDSILLHVRSKNILIDTGGSSAYSNDSSGEIFYNTIQPILKSSGIKKLNYLILTHGDKDHLGEAETLINNYKVDRIIINSNNINYYEKKLICNKTIIGEEGLTIKFNKFTMIQLNEDLDDENDSSQIYLVKYNNIKLLLTGDASIKSEKNLLSKYDLGKINILKIGHHGSRTSTSELLLKEVMPDIALISSGRDNKFNHPHQEVLDLLNKYNIKIYNTQDDGTITINLNNLKVSTIY
jgi:competence protein ComEC